ncbi:hypothetical protein DN398_26385 [Bacillus sp. JAS102]|uniref:hypothetical protein n=1 Tax=Bacillus cereus group TaxID=86661 RepID=UPI0011EE9433|nr:hypothetical protein [Bacillus sp. JAS102]KAA0796443.1 hypothetical protein DN398_26385 [Bacillus sp. JAS102]
MTLALDLIKSEYVELKDEGICIKEDIENEHGKVTMEVTIDKLKEDKDLYHIFCEPGSKKNEESRIKFFLLNKFPDGCFFTYDESTGEIECYICDLKKKPSNQLAKLKEQLFSGLIHCKTLFSLLDIEMEKVKFNFVVYFIVDVNVEVEYNNLRGMPKKVTPGREVTAPSDYENWKQGKSIFSKGSYSHTMNLQKIKLNQISEELYTFEHLI